MYPVIIIDFNGIALSSIITQKLDIKEDLIRHVILNTIRMYNKKFRDEYGQMVIACDAGSWRRDYFPNYKFKRRESREESTTMDWNEIFRIINSVRDDLKEHFPYKVVYVQKAEADDIIGTLAFESQEFGKHEPVMIVSADKDFIQLHRFTNVKQYSPMFKKFITEKNPHTYLIEHIFKGDSGDGVPNVLSPDNTFSESIRQTPVTKKKIEAWIAGIDNIESVMDQETYRNYLRNKKLIDLSETPDLVKQEIINSYNEQKLAHKSRVLNYLIKKRCKLLIDCVGDFY
jgi:5'-3' exonuclease